MPKTPKSHRLAVAPDPDPHLSFSTGEELATHLSVEHGLQFAGVPDYGVLAQLHERVHQIDLNLKRSAEVFDVGLMEWQQVAS